MCQAAVAGMVRERPASGQGGPLRACRSVQGAIESVLVGCHRNAPERVESLTSTSECSACDLSLSDLNSE